MGALRLTGLGHMILWESSQSNTKGHCGCHLFFSAVWWFCSFLSRWVLSPLAATAPNSLPKDQVDGAASTNGGVYVRTEERAEINLGYSKLLTNSWTHPLTKLSERNEASTRALEESTAPEEWIGFLWKHWSLCQVWADSGDNISGGFKRSKSSTLRPRQKEPLP